MSEVIGEDRISDLPDALLHHILSFVHTKFAVRTSVLSKRWKKVWSFFPNLDLYCHDFRSFDSFMFFVNRVLLLRHPSDIKEFRLTCWQHKDEYVSHVDGWIRAAIMRNPVVLDLKLASLFGGRVPLPMLPLSLFMCETLVVLKLWSHLIPSTSTAWCLPNLKVLLVTVQYPDNDPIENVLSHCPAVEDLTINGVVGEHVLNFKVYAFHLKTLTIRLTTREGDHHARQNELTLSIRAPKLESFDLQQSVLSNIILGNAASLVKATIGLYEPCFYRSELPAFIYRAAALFKQICNVRYLSLSAHCLEARHLPAFGNLNHLKLDIHHCCYWWKQFLKGIPNLKSLVLVLGMHCNCHKVLGRFNNTLPEGNLLDSVPSCLSSSLKTICIKGYLGHHDDLDIAKYLLENGQVLNCMKIYTKQTLVCSKEEIYKQLLTFGSASKTCLVEITEGET